LREIYKGESENKNKVVQTEAKEKIQD